MVLYLELITIGFLTDHRENHAKRLAVLMILVRDAGGAGCGHPQGHNAWRKIN